MTLALEMLQANGIVPINKKRKYVGAVPNDVLDLTMDEDDNSSGRVKPSGV